MKRTKSRLLAVAIASVLTLTACSPGGSGGKETDPAASGSGGEIRVASTDPIILIPGRQAVAYDFNMAVWAPLTFVDASGKITYVAAESIETDDSTTYTIKLRDGWTFHDGTPVTAQDYVDSWNAVAYGPNAFENSGQLARVVGFDEVTAEKPAETMSGLKVIDELTFSVTLMSPDSQFPMQVSQAQTAMFPMPKSAFADFDAYNKHPIGNGPFQMVGDYSEMDPIEITAYPDFKGDKPTVSKITFVPYADTGTAYNDVLAGNIDVAGLPPTKMIQSATDFTEGHVYAFPAPGISFLGIPTWDKRYADIRVRQAISMAIDRESINEVVYGGLYVPANAFTPEIEPGTPAGICGELCEFHPDKAKALLAEAGGFSGTVEIYYPGGSGLDEFYTAIANSIRQSLGVEAVAVPSSDWAEFYQNRLDKKVPGPYFSRWGALYPSQQATLRALFVEGGGCTNCIAEYDSKVLELMNAADAAVETADVEAAYKAVHERLLEVFPVPPLFQESYSYVTSERVAKLNTSAAGNPNYGQTILVDGK